MQCPYLKRYWHHLLYNLEPTAPGLLNELAAMRRNPAIMKRVAKARKQLNLEVTHDSRTA